RQVTGACSQPHSLEVLAGELVSSATRHALVVERQGYVFFRRLEAEQIERLKDEADQAVAIVRGLGLAQISDQLVVEVVSAAIVVIQNAQDVEQRGLAGTR